jgi:hypothetical protein
VIIASKDHSPSVDVLRAELCDPVGALQVYQVISQTHENFCVSIQHGLVENGFLGSIRIAAYVTAGLKIIP